MSILDPSTYEPLLNQPAPTSGLITDALASAAQILSVFLSILSGIEAFQKADQYSAVFGIGAGLFSTAAIFLTGRSSRIRDRKLAVAVSLGMLSLNMADRAQRLGPFD